MKKLLLVFKKMTLGKAAILAIISPILVILMGMQTMMLGLLIVIIIDTLTGIRKAHFLAGIKFRPFAGEFWRVIKSKQMRVSIRKTCEYAIYIIIFIVLEIMLLGKTEIPFIGNNYTIPEIVIIALFFIEVYSRCC